MSVADLFTLGVGPWTGDDPIYEVGQFGSVGLSMNLDDGGSISFNLPALAPSAAAIDELATDLWLYIGGTPFMRTRITSVQQEWGEDGVDQLAITSVCYKRLMTSRNLWTPLSFSGVDQADIVWALIEHTQAQVNGDLGIVEGTLAAGVPRERNWTAGQNIGKLLADLSAVIDGPWWGVNALKELDVHPFDTFDVRSTPVERGATARVLRRGSGAAGFCNAAWITGDGGFTVPVGYEPPDLATDPRGRWERVEGYPSVKEQDTLVEKAEGVVQVGRSPVATWTAVMEPSRWLTDARFLPGDFVQIIVPPTTVATLPDSAAVVKGGQVLNLDAGLDSDGGFAVTITIAEIPEAA